MRDEAYRAKINFKLQWRRQMGEEGILVLLGKKNGERFSYWFDMLRGLNKSGSNKLNRFETLTLTFLKLFK